MAAVPMRRGVCTVSKACQLWCGRGGGGLIRAYCTVTRAQYQAISAQIVTAIGIARSVGRLFHDQEASAMTISRAWSVQPTSTTPTSTGSTAAPQIQRIPATAATRHHDHSGHGTILVRKNCVSHVSHGLIRVA